MIFQHHMAARMQPLMAWGHHRGCLAAPGVPHGPELRGSLSQHPCDPLPAAAAKHQGSVNKWVTKLGVTTSNLTFFKASRKFKTVFPPPPSSLLLLQHPPHQNFLLSCLGLWIRETRQASLLLWLWNTRRARELPLWPFSSQMVWIPPLRLQVQFQVYISSSTFTVPAEFLITSRAHPKPHRRQCPVFFHCCMWGVGAWISS